MGSGYLSFSDVVSGHSASAGQAVGSHGFGYVIRSPYTPYSIYLRGTINTRVLSYSDSQITGLSL